MTMRQKTKEKEHDQPFRAIRAKCMSTASSIHNSSSPCACPGHYPAMTDPLCIPVEFYTCATSHELELDTSNSRWPQLHAICGTDRNTTLPHVTALGVAGHASRRWIRPSTFFDTTQELSQYPGRSLCLPCHMHSIASQNLCLEISGQPRRFPAIAQQRCQCSRIRHHAAAGA